MATGEIPDDLRRLIIDRIDSIPELEAILLLRRTRGRTWTAEQAGRALYVSEPVAAHVLKALAERGFFDAAEHGYGYRPESTELELLVDRLAECYSTRLIAVTEFIHAKPSSAVRHFARAFRLRRED